MKFSHRYINIFGLREILQRRIPLMTLDSGVPGPVVWFTGCIHGDEVGGVVIIQEVFKALRKYRLDRGVIHAFPLINSLGYENVSRYVNNDREDLNRCFPGHPKGSMGERIAYKIFNAITNSNPDLVVDIHNDWIQSIPYMIIDPEQIFFSNEIRDFSINRALSSGMAVVEESGLIGQSDRSLAGALVQSGIPAFTMEAGGAYLIIEKHVNSGLQAIFRILKSMGMISAEFPHQEDFSFDPQLSNGVFQYSNKPLCSSSGLLRFLVKPSQRVRPQQHLAKVYNAFGAVEEILKSDCNGYVLGHHDHALAMPGKEVFAIARMD